MWNPHVSPLPPSGICPAAAANSTPGSAFNPATIWSVFTTTASSFAYAVPTIEICIVSTWLASKPGFTPEQVRDALDHQPGADEQHDRHGHVGGDQQPAREGGWRVRRLAPFAVERRLEVDARGADGRQESEEKRRRHRERHRKGQHASVELRVGEPRDRGRRQMNQQRNGDGADGDAERAAGDGQQSALDHELPHQPRAAGAERGAQREVALAPCNAREQQARHVGARDQQDEADRAHQHAERRPDPAGQLVAERHERHRGGRILGRQLAAQLGLDRVDVGARGLERRARLQAADGLQMLARAAGGRERAVVSDERPHVGALIEALRDERLEGRRHDADRR